MKKQFVNVRRNFFIISFLVLTVLFFGPLGLFLGNGEELWFSLKEVLTVIIPVSLAAAAALCLLSFVLPRNLSRIFGMFLLGAGLGCYIQGHFINISYGTGVMDGTPINWSEYAGYGIRNTIIWAVCLALPFIVSRLMKKKWKKIFHLFTYVSLLLIVIQIPSLVMQVINYRPNTNTDILITKDGMFDVSPKENVFIYIIDTLDEAYYREFIEEEPEYKDVLKGFVHYDNVLASGCRTTLGLPSMFTGVPFIRTETYSEYKNKAWGNTNSLSVMADAGYDVGFYSEPQLFSTANISYFSNFRDSGTHVDHWTVFAKKLYKLDFFKYAPHYLKRFFYIDTAEFDQAIETADSNKYVINDPVFYKNYRDEGFTVDESLNKAVRIYHLRGTHAPYVLSRDGLRDNKATRQDTAAGNFHVIHEMFDELKEKGVYDSSLIILTADHGDAHVAEYASLLIKEPFDNEPYRDNHAPVSLFDLGIYLAEYAGKELPAQPYGMSISSLHEGDERERHFFQSTTLNNQKVTIEHMTTGFAGNRDSLIKVQTYYDTKGADTPYYLGTVLNFDADATGNRYITDGHWFNNDWRTYLLNDYGKMQFPIADLPKDGEVRVWIELNNNRVDGVDFTISANGKDIYQNRTGKELCDSEIDFNVPVSYFSGDNVLTLEFQLKDVTEELLNDSKTKSNGFISMTSMVIEKAK